MRQPTIDDPGLSLARLFELWPLTGRAFLERRMLCFGCPVAPFYTVGDAVRQYGLDEEAFRVRLRELAGEPAGPHPAPIPPLPREA